LCVYSKKTPKQKKNKKKQKTPKKNNNNNPIKPNQTRGSAFGAQAQSALNGGLSDKLNL
jgi:hypothetical protein